MQLKDGWALTAITNVIERFNDSVFATCSPTSAVSADDYHPKKLLQVDIKIGTVFYVL